jgi:valyl-tRNA synthetase
MALLSKSYDPVAVEPKWVDYWEEGQYFRADNTSEKPPFCIVIPPPNVTGVLHMGHALFATLQDIFIRWKRMAGYEALWLPGTDHAGIATQVLVQRHLSAQGIDAREIGREAFLEHAWRWKHTYHERITNQLKAMGVSVDWARERFTMDEGLSRAVREVFVRLYQEGLIYRAERLVNWDPEGQTVLSDLEVEQEEEDGFLWHIAYPLVDEPERRLVVATTRPETMLGDTAVAVHPDDPRYADLVGRSVHLPLTDRDIPVIADPVAADMAFGSGAVKITPGHDFNDFETGLRNDLPRITILDTDGRINENAPEAYQGLDRLVARDRVVEDLEAAGLLVKIEPYRFAPGRSQRTGAIVEPMSIGNQWFVDAVKLAGPAIEAVKTGRTTFVPPSWAKTYFNWMENIREWCISRQLWWGHRIPAWYCPENHVTVAGAPPERCADCGSSQLVQDPDVLDTWFSSGLWPFSTLGWPDETQDLAKFYPTQLMETGYDIIFFWVARMMMMGLHFMGEVPFKVVYLHGMIRDKTGKKMSKTNRNVVDPLHVINGVKPEDLTEEERHHYEVLFKEFPHGIEPQGADALRFTLAILSAQGRDIKLDIKRIVGYRAFLNKIWNAARFVLGNLDGYEAQAFDYDALDEATPPDRWILGRLHRATKAVNAALSEYRISDAAETLYQFTWYELCAWYLELSKQVLYDDDPAKDGARRSAQATLVHCLDTVLRLLHPFTPYVTEEIWQALPNHDDAVASVAIGTWPTPERVPDVVDEANMQLAIDVIAGIRAVRGHNNIPPKATLPRVLLYTDDTEALAQLDALTTYVNTQAKIDHIEVFSPDAERPHPAATTVQSGIEIVIPLAGLIDLEAETKRLEKELRQVEDDIAFVKKRLDNPKFVERAPSHVVDRERDKLETYLAARQTLQEGLGALRGQSASS